jgi:hypothetical protein
MRARIDAHREEGGLTPTPDEPPHRSINLWAFATLWGIGGRRIVAFYHDATFIIPMMSRRGKIP